MVVFKKVMRFLFVLPLAFPVLLPFDSWGMNDDPMQGGPTGPMDLKRKNPGGPMPSEKRQKIEISSYSFADFPDDFLYEIYGDVPPPYWIHAEKVCKHWHGAFNHTNWWKIAGGWRSSPPLKSQETLTILNSFFDIAPPRVKNKFPFKWPLTEFPFSAFYTNPPIGALKNSYISKYVKALKGTEESLIYLQKAADAGHPNAVSKLAKEDLKFHMSSGGKPEANNKCLMAALAGVPGAQTRFYKILLTTLAWKNSTTLCGLNFPDQFKYCVQLAEMWPGCREALLSTIISSRMADGLIPEEFILKLRDIGEGRKTTLAFGNTEVNLEVTWPETFFMIGKEDLKKAGLAMEPSLVSSAYKNFLKAPAETKAGHLLAHAVRQTKDSIKFWQEIQNDFPQSLGTALAQITLFKLYENLYEAPGNQLKAQEFLQFVRDSYEQILMTTTHFPSLTKRMQHKQNPKDWKATNVGEYIDWVGEELIIRAASIEIKTCFLDWARTTPQYVHMPWASKIIAEYLSKKWGNELINKGSFKKGTNKKNWNEQDTERALEYFQFRKDFPLDRRVLRTFCSRLMSMKNNEEETFRRCFRELCKSYAPTRSNDKFEGKNRENIKKLLDTFLETHPKNAELPLLFAKLPHGISAFAAKLKKDYFEIAAKNGSTEAIEYFKTAAQNGSTEAEEFLVLLGANSLLSLKPKPEEKPTPQGKTSTRNSDKMGDD